MKVFAPLAVVAALVAALTAAAPEPLSGQQPAGPGAPAPAARPTPPPRDPFAWLEEIDSPRAMAWVRARNAATMRTVGAAPLYHELYDRVLAALNARDRIALPRIVGDRIYNFWQDAQHPRGILRRTSWDTYLTGEPAWETVLDVDSLAAAEKVPWSYQTMRCLPPAYRRCLLPLSRGGADAAQIREFDLESRQFVRDGFFLPEAKQSVAWVGPDTLLVATDFAPGSLTTSGYPRLAKLWRRGTPLSAARTLLEIPATETEVGVDVTETSSGPLGIVTRRPSFFESRTYVLRGDSLVQLDLPLDADPSFVGDQLVVYLRKPWTVGGRTLPEDAVVAEPFGAFLRGDRDFRLVTAGGGRRTITEVRALKDVLLVMALDNVRPELLRFRLGANGWTADTIPAPGLGDISLVGTSPTTNRFFFTFESFTQPPTLYGAGEDGAVRELKRMPARFDASNLVTDQLEATSKDGTRIPYFIVHRKGMPYNGQNPTLMFGYGGFEIAELPDYNITRGVAWLARGGTFVLANIRGGGEFGPAWHRSAMRENRQRAYDDFIAVGQDLVRRGITSPAHLGITGRSNGGLLMGNMLTQRPDLWNAIVIGNPLLDMYRYSHLLAGASWIAEYGDPDVPSDWAFLSKYSAYQNLKRGQRYPPPLIATTTRDDRVHPGHARKFAARLLSLGYPVYFYENIEGGHGTRTNPQRAREESLFYTYLWQRLASPHPGESASGAQ